VELFSPLYSQIPFYQVEKFLPSSTALPNFDSFVVTRAYQNLSIWAENNGINLLGVTSKSAEEFSRLQMPESHSFVFTGAG